MPEEEAPRYCAPLLRTGDAVLMDACCFHAGGANTLRPRSLFHLSFSRAGFRPTGFAHYAQSLHADITGVAGSRHRLDETARWLDAPAP